MPRENIGKFPVKEARENIRGIVLINVCYDFIIEINSEEISI